MMHVLGDWRLVALRAFAALVFGVLTLIWPGITLWTLVVLFGAYVLVDGLFELADVVRSTPETRSHRAWHIFDGLLGVAAGIVTFVWPGITALALLFLIGIWAVLAGAVRLWMSIEARRVLPYPWLVGLSGVLSIVFGVALMITPGTGALVITWLIGWYAVVFAVALFALAWYLRGIERASGPHGSRATRAATA